MKFAAAIIALIIAALVLPFLVPIGSQRPGVDPEANLPWQIEVDGQGGSRVFGLRPGASTLGEMRQRLGGELEVAIIAAPNEVGTLEAYVAQVPLGFVLARVIATVDVEKSQIIAMRERALKAEHMESATRKIKLNPDDLAAADSLPVKAISVIPTVNLDEATVIQRFGQPGERVALGEKRVHLLYPDKGLDVVVDADGKELLQYVAPKQFSILRDPLVSTAAPDSKPQAGRDPA